MEQKGKETTGTGKPYEGEGGKEKRYEGREKTGDLERKDFTGPFMKREEGITYGTRSGYGGEMKLTASTALKEAKTVLGNVLLRTLSGAEKTAAEKLCTAWKSLADWSAGSYESSYKCYIQTSLKYDEAKHALRSLKMAHLDAQCEQFCAVAKNMCEKHEKLKRWLDKNKTYDATKKKDKFLKKDCEWIESICRFVEVGMTTCHCYHDAFDESVRDYSFYVQKLEKCLERIKEFKEMKEKMDPDTYMKYKKWLVECKKDTEKKMICAKIDTEDIRRSIVHFHHDFVDCTTDTLEFLKLRIPEYEKLGRQHADNTSLRNCVDLLNKKAVQVRDMLDNFLKRDKEKIPKFEDKKYVERLVQSHLRVYAESSGIGTKTTSAGTSIRVGGDK